MKDEELYPYLPTDWRSFKDILFAFNGERALPVPQGKVQAAMNGLVREGVLEKCEAKSRLKCIADDMRLYRLKGGGS